MRKKLEIIVNSRWKMTNEVYMYLIKPLVLVYLRLKGVKIGKNSKFYGFPKIFRTRGSTIEIGNNFECRSWWYSNPIGINHPTIICTWGRGAKIKIGNDVGISGGSIVASREIIIGNNILVGANAVIIDSDFHPTKGKNKRYSRENVGEKPVKIGDNVFIGMNAIILKGAKVKNGSVVPAGGVIR